jgi:hypothetical protein
MDIDLRLKCEISSLLSEKFKTQLLTYTHPPQLKKLKELRQQKD